VLVLSRAFPNNVFTLLGLWAARIVAATGDVADAKVVSPVPWCPPVPGLPAYYSDYRRVARHDWSVDAEVFRPRFIAGPGLALYNVEPAFYYAGVRRTVARIRRDFPFDLVHAHFVYPDGVVAARIAREYDVPLVITEHAPWGPWLDESPLVRRQTVWAAERSAAHVVPSTAVLRSVERYRPADARMRVVPNVVDDSVFTLASDDPPRDPRQILFAGAVRHVKGVDVLLQAIRLLADRGCDAHLVVVGEPFYAAYRREEERLRALALELGLGGSVRFAGPQQPHELARTMQTSAVVVLPSRAESFGVVLAEALACGTPVVATRCGGPEDIVDDSVGVLVPPEDPESLADGLAHVLGSRDGYDARTLSATALERYGTAAVGRRYGEIYAEVLGVA